MFLFFLLLHLTTEAMGIGGLREHSLSPKRQSECGRKTAEMHVSQPMRIGGC